MALAVDDDEHRIAASVGEALRAGSATDPDYQTLWPDPVSVRGVTVEGRTVTVDLADVGTAPRAGTPALAVQQLVSTVAAAATYTSVKRIDGVRITVDGAPVREALERGGHQPAGEAGAAVGDLRAGVGDRPAARPAWWAGSFTVHLAGIVFEGTVGCGCGAPAGRSWSSRSCSCPWGRRRSARRGCR